MGCGTGPFDRGHAFRVILGFVRGDGETRINLKKIDPFYQQEFRDVYDDFRRDLEKVLTCANVELGDWEELTDADGNHILVLKVLGTSRNVFTKQAGKVTLRDGNFTESTAITVNCKVNEVLRDVRMQREQRNGKIIRKSRSVVPIVIDNVGPDSDATSNDGTSRGVCGNDDHDPTFGQYCCQSS